MNTPLSSDLANTYCPLSVEEVLRLFRLRWDVSYDMRLLRRNNHLFLQIMWGFLEQQSFPLNEEQYLKNLNETIEIVNRVGQAMLVREWIVSVPNKPRIGRPLTLRLRGEGCLAEFIL